MNILQSTLFFKTVLGNNFRISLFSNELIKSLYFFMQLIKNQQAA